MKILKLITILATLALGTSAYSAGFQVLEQGSSNIGTAMAGSVTNANEDATAAFWNPSAASFMKLEAGQTMVTQALTLILPTIEYNGADGSTARGDSPLWVANLYVVHKIDEDFTFTFSMTSPYGLESDYGTSWVGSNEAVQSRVLTLDLNPSLAYKVTDWLSISGGISLQYMECKLSSMADIGYGFSQEMALRGSGWGVGGNVGFTIEYMEGGRFAFQWRSEVVQDAYGTAKWGSTEVGDITASVTMPQTFTMGIYQRFQGDFSEFAAMIDYCYTGWSSFESLDIHGSVNTSTAENWKDTSRISVGFHYYPEECEGLTLRLGAAWDESPTSAQYRTARIPDSDRVWVSAGAGYVYENMKFDFGYAYVLGVGDSTITEGSLDGDYSTASHLISFQVSMLF